MAILTGSHRALILSASAVFVLIAGSVAPGQQADLVTNSMFKEWQDQSPTGWTVAKGSGDGQQPFSIIEAMKGSGITLAGDAKTRTWRSISQTVAAKPGDTLRLLFEAQVAGVQREGDQFDNCWVGLFFSDAAGKRIGTEVFPVTAKKLRKQKRSITVPPKTAKAEVMAFLSKTGKLQIKQISLNAGKEQTPFEMLVDEMGLHYSYFDLKKIDWPKLTAKYQAKAEKAKEPAEFIEAIRPMLTELEDMHVNIVDPSGKWISTLEAEVPPKNINFAPIKKQLVKSKQFGKMALIGKTKENVGYLLIGGLPVDEKLTGQVLKAMKGLKDVRGIIVDLRLNGGGDEPTAKMIAGRFTDAEMVYAKSKYRNGPDPTDFGSISERVLMPNGESPLLQPTVCLIGPRCVSSGEGMAKMLKALPQVTLMGQPTRGSSGNPRPVELSNGVQVYYSRWVDMLPDETAVEGVGVPPDVVIKHQRSKTVDPTFEAALKLILKKE